MGSTTLVSGGYGQRSVTTVTSDDCRLTQSREHTSGDQTNRDPHWTGPQSTLLASATTVTHAPPAASPARLLGATGTRSVLLPGVPRDGSPPAKDRVWVMKARTRWAQTDPIEPDKLIECNPTRLRRPNLAVPSAAQHRQRLGTARQGTATGPGETTDRGPLPQSHSRRRRCSPLGPRTRGVCRVGNSRHALSRNHPRCEGPSSICRSGCVSRITTVPRLRFQRTRRRCNQLVR